MITTASSPDACQTKSSLSSLRIWLANIVARNAYCGGLQTEQGV